MTHFCALTSSRSQSGNKADSFAVPTGIAIQRCKLETFKRLCDLKFAMTATCLQWKQCSAWPGKNVTNWWFFIFDNLLLAKLFPARRKSAVSWHVFKKKNLNLWNNRKILLRFVYIPRWYLLSWTLVLAQLPNKLETCLVRWSDYFARLIHFGSRGPRMFVFARLSRICHWKALTEKAWRKAVQTLGKFRQVRNSSDHSPIGKKLFMLKLARLRETWKMTASVFLPDAKTKTSWPLETCSIKGCWFAMIVFCICLILHSLFSHWVSL